MKLLNQVDIFAISGGVNPERNDGYNFEYVLNSLVVGGVIGAVVYKNGDAVVACAIVGASYAIIRLACYQVDKRLFS